MRICIDSNQFILGIGGADAAAERLMLTLPRLEIVVPRLVINEVTRNLGVSEVKMLYGLLNKSPRFSIVDEAVPKYLVTKYVALGLREKGDAFIGAFATRQKVGFLISDNRHFLAELHTTAFTVLAPTDFLNWYSPTA